MFSLLWLACSGVMLVDKGVGGWLFVCFFEWNCSIFEGENGVWLGTVLL